MVLINSYLQRPSDIVNPQSTIKNMLELREELVSKNKIINENGNFKLLTDLPFPTAFKAAVFVYGKSCSANFWWTGEKK